MRERWPEPEGRRTGTRLAQASPPPRRAAAHHNIASFIEQPTVRTNLVQAVYGPMRIRLVHEHSAIVDAIAARKVGKVGAPMRQHIESIERACDLTERSGNAVDREAIFPMPTP